MKTPEPHSPTASFPEMSSDGRLEEMMLYVAEQSKDDPNFGATKLNKILFFADFCAYGRRGRPVTGAEYMKLDQGPVPRRLKAVKSILLATEQAEEKIEPAGAYLQHRLEAKRKPNLAAFSSEDIAIVDEMIAKLRHANGRDVSELSHNRIWRIAGTKDTIPYEAVFVSDLNPDDRDIQDAHELIEKHGWRV